MVMNSQGSHSFSAFAAICILCLLITAGAEVVAQKPINDGALLDSTTPKPTLYSPDADARKEIGEAVKCATAENKRVLLLFGANWCYDCHVLDQALHQGEAGTIVSESFLIVHVDIGEGEQNPDLVKQYKIPLEKGVPAVAVLDREGRLLYSSGLGEFEAARRMMKKDLVAFLNHWKAPPSIK